MPKAQVSDILLSIGQDFTKLGSLLANNKAEVLAASSNVKAASSHPPKKRVKKDIHAPKRNITSYLHFSNKNRERLVRDNPDLAQTEIAKLMGEEWRKLTDAEKEPFQKLANEDKARFDKEMAAYKPGEVKEVATSTAPAKKARTASPSPAPVAAEAPAPTESTKSSKKHKKHKK
ncbi:high mobility group box domain-containing protein [Absidia repens]|uniref:High mobility group box domain-containing protein n=1 Tax=Absidia repens TaxID=90262 RepID=A0A1X2ITM4_9FUNG|nr:high mobility group box domain-containing protein [Absidia repens]